MVADHHQLRWLDATVAFALAVAGSVAVVVALRAGVIPGVVANYLAHGWMAAIALTWFFLLGRPFPIGGLDQRQLRPWYVVALVAIAVNVVAVIASPPAGHLHLPGPPTLAAQLVFLAFVVGPTEELLFRGLIQTSLDGSIHARVSLRRWPLHLGTVVAAILFGLFHLVNLGYQPLAATLEQVLIAIFIGLVFGVLYDRTRNLIGAGLAHSVTDFSGTVIPLLAYLAANR